MKHKILIIGVAIIIMSIGFMIGHMYNEIEFHIDNKVIIHGYCK